VNEQHMSDTNANQLLAVVNPAGVIDPTNVVPFAVDYDNEFEIYTAELNQIFQRERHTDVFGVRYQDGWFNADATLDQPPPALAPLFALRSCPPRTRTSGGFPCMLTTTGKSWMDSC